MGILAVFFAKLLSPIGAVIALVLGAMAPSKWMILVGAIVAAMGSEMILQSVQAGREPNGAVFVISVFSFAIWAAIGNVFVRRVFSKRADEK